MLAIPICSLYPAGIPSFHHWLKHLNTPHSLVFQSTLVPVLPVGQNMLQRYLCRLHKDLTTLEPKFGAYLVVHPT